MPSPSEIRESNIERVHSFDNFFVHASLCPIARSFRSLVCVAVVGSDISQSAFFGLCTCFVLQALEVESIELWVASNKVSIIRFSRAVCRSLWWQIPDRMLRHCSPSLSSSPERSLLEWRRIPIPTSSSSSSADKSFNHLSHSLFGSLAVCLVNDKANQWCFSFASIPSSPSSFPSSVPFLLFHHHHNRRHFHPALCLVEWHKLRPDSTHFVCSSPTRYRFIGLINISLFCSSTNHRYPLRHQHRYSFLWPPWFEKHDSVGVPQWFVRLARLKSFNLSCTLFATLSSSNSIFAAFTCQSLKLHPVCSMF